MRQKEKIVFDNIAYQGKHIFITMNEDDIAEWYYSFNLYAFTNDKEGKLLEMRLV